MQACQNASSCYLPLCATQNSTELDSTNNISSTGIPICYVDGSWSPDGNAGIGGFVISHGRVVQWLSQRVQAMNSAQAEAHAVLQGYKMLLSESGNRGLLFSDSMEIVDSLAHNPPQIHDWRAYNEVWEAWQLQHSQQNRLKTNYCSREDSRIQLAHSLANIGRVNGWNRIEIDLNLDPQDLDSFVVRHVSSEIM